MCNRVNPDFGKWADNILDRSELAEALEQAFNQGWYAGYHDGQERGWVDVLESDQAFVDGYYGVPLDAKKQEDKEA